MIEEELLAEVEQKVPPKWLAERVQSLNQLNTEEIPELEMIVDDLLSEGPTVLAEMLKAGKSYLVTNIGMAVAEGRPAQGQSAVKQGRVLYITPDDKQKARLRARLNAMREGRTGDIPFDIAQNWTQLDDGGIDELVEYLDYYADTRLIIIDVLMNVLQGSSEDVNAYDRIYQKLEPLKALAQERHIAIVLVMHMNKGQNGGNPRSRIYGSMAYGAIADNILLLDEDYQTHQRFLLTAGKDLEQKKIALAFNPATGVYAYGEEHAAELQEKTASQNIGDMVKAQPGITRAQIIVNLVNKGGVKFEAADKRVTRAARNGQICSFSGHTGFYPCNYQPPTPG